MTEIRSWKKEFYLTLFSFFIFLTPLYSQINVEGQYKTAETLYKSEHYFDAVTEYKRLLFFDASGKWSFEGNLKIALCYKMGGKYDSAIQFFIKAEKSAPTPEDKFNVQIQIIRTNILRKTTGRAIELLDLLEADKGNISKIEEINYWRGWAYMLGDDFEKASAQFALTGMGEELKKICDKAHSDKYSVTFAKVISYILPGAGQIYTGEILSGILSGIMSLGWNVLFGYLTVNSFVENRIFDGILTGDLLFLRFYRGNIQNAEKFAIEKNLDITNKTLFYIQNNYKGIKP